MSDKNLWDVLLTQLKNILELKATLEAFDFSVDLDIDRLGEEEFYIGIKVFGAAADIDMLIHNVRDAGLTLLIDDLFDPAPRLDSDDVLHRRAGGKGE